MALRPEDGIGVGTFAGKIDGLQVGQVIAADQQPFGIIALDGAQRGGCGEEGAHLMFGDHPPEGPGIGSADRLAFIDDRCASGDQRAIADIAVAHDPAHVGRRPEHIARTGVVDGAHRPVQRHQMPGGGAHHALGRAGGARGIKDIGRMAALDRHALRRFHAVLKAVPGHIAALDQLRHLLLALQDHAELGLVAGHVDGPVQERLVMHHPARLDPARGGDDRLGRAVIDPHGQFCSGKAAEDDGMDRAQPRAGQHRLQRLGDHRHVDDHPVALGDALGAQRAGQRCDALLQFGIGDGALRMGDGAVMDDRRLVAAPGQHMPVDRVPAGVHGGIRKPVINRRTVG